MVSPLTSAYPDNPRSEWVLDWAKQPLLSADGLLAFEYAVYPTAASLAALDKPFLLNSHKAMVRETHQRIQQTPLGAYLHVSGVSVAPGDVNEFLATDPRAYRWASIDKDGNWVDEKGNAFAPFVFPDYWGNPEGLDPQWLRETFLLPQAVQVAELVASYLASVEARRLSGDKRGTTLDLQVGASADDAHWNQGNSTLVATTNDPVGWNDAANGDRNAFARFTAVSIANGAAIDVAYLTYNPTDTDSATVVNLILKAIAGDNPAAPTTYSEAETATRTTATVAWSGVPTWTAATPINTPSIVTITQELVNRAGWVSGSTQVYYLEENGSDHLALRIRRPSSYNIDTTKAPKLHIEYTAGGGSAVPVFDHHYRMQRA